MLFIFIFLKNTLQQPVLVMLMNNHFEWETSFVQCVWCKSINFQVISNDNTFSLVLNIFTKIVNLNNKQVCGSRNYWGHSKYKLKRCSNKECWTYIYSFLSKRHYLSQHFVIPFAKLVYLVYLTICWPIIFLWKWNRIQFFKVIYMSKIYILEKNII